ncbi:MAG: hypothetical protein H5T76_31825, partial [Streptomyces sp.]|nr:hypothetical protein [Streptomyces sp.]
MNKNIRRSIVLAAGVTGAWALGTSIASADELPASTLSTPDATTETVAGTTETVAGTAETVADTTDAAETVADTTDTVADALPAWGTVDVTHTDEGAEAEVAVEA